MYLFMNKLSIFLICGCCLLLSGCGSNDIKVDTYPVEDLFSIATTEEVTTEITTEEVTEEVIRSDEAIISVDGYETNIQSYAYKKDILSQEYGDYFGRLIIPTCNIDTTIVVGANQFSVDNNDVCISTKGSYCGDTNPVLLCGHKTNSLGKVYNIQEGDYIIVKAVYGTYVYEVYYTEYGSINSDSTNIVDIDGNNMLEFDNNLSILQIYTCYGEDNGTERFVVKARQLAGTFIIEE